MGSPATALSFPPQLHHHRCRCLLSPPPLSKSPTPNPIPINPHPLPNRRSLLLLSSSSAAASLLPLSAAADTDASALSPAPSSPLSAAVTERVYMDFSLCPSYFRSDRPLGSDLAACPDPEPLGRVVFGLYGKLLPQTVANFKAMCASAAYRGTLVHKVLQGQFFVAGRQGRREKGEVRPPLELARNMETVDPRAFQLKHLRPGTLSLCLSQNDDDEAIRLNPNYHNVEFLVTTGPGPCPQLDNENIVFGTVLEGLDVVTTIATIPTYKPAERIRQFNDFAEFIGDERAQIARTMWNRPLKTVYISDCGELKVAKPSLSPSLP
ncbi:peptidyl-prolyl cis-trans isomerase CYP28, chloroplastic [Elaeis guineensis]|uniref:LOW QUALITY PROTEIN: peptidyl-prolyl cis-trans isomerase CYP28, chloroplastic n=1 Tax=Elaeis guineensis var. tenera TaxID=51953 RepID=A0A6I9QT86_ELAGV|nr:LOW QUALITY PROTEIN: peptidyl-prolyl cis-trans isomerase CYP28, chloroplastic [Elaeis guineensis]